MKVASLTGASFGVALTTGYLAGAHLVSVTTTVLWIVAVMLITPFFTRGHSVPKGWASAARDEGRG